MNEVPEGESANRRLNKARSFGSLGQYDENGVDLSLIRANMKLTATERACRAERARRAALRVQQIGRDARNKPT